MSQINGSLQRRSHSIPKALQIQSFSTGFFHRRRVTVIVILPASKRARFSRPAGARADRAAATLTGLKETIKELPAFVRVAADLGVREVYLQRLVFFDRARIEIARPDQALFESITGDEAVYLKEAPDLACSLGITFNASGTGVRQIPDGQYC